MLYKPKGVLIEQMNKLISYWKNSIVNKVLIIIIITWVALATIFGFTDLAISAAVADRDSPWGNFGADYGEAPGYGFIAIAIGILIAAAISKKNEDIHKQKYPALILSLIFVGVMIYGIIDDHQRTAITTGGIGLPLLGFTLITWNKQWSNWQKFALVIVILAILNPLLLVQIIKLVWGRVRPRDVLWEGGIFTEWWVINGYTGNQSFPSGHTAMGWMFLPLLILAANRIKENRSSKNILIAISLSILVLGWGLFVGMSRVAVGAHYASDALFSTAFASIITIWLYKRYYK